MALAQHLCSLCITRNGHSVRLVYLANKLKITICALSIGCTNKKKRHKTLKMYLQENYVKNSILEGF